MSKKPNLHLDFSTGTTPATVEEPFAATLPESGTLSNDALIFGFGYLNGPKRKLSFGGEGAEMAITPRARAALDELLASGHAVVTEPSDQIIGREHYRGTMAEPSLGEMAKAAGFNPFDSSLNFKTFVKKALLEAGTEHL